MPLPEGVSQVYVAANEQWGEPLLSVVDARGQRICRIPHAFLTRAGVDPVRLAAEMAQMCVHDAGMLCSSDGASEITTQEQLFNSAQLLWKTSPEVETTSYVKGPRFHRAVRPPPDEEDSTMSHSSRSSINQNSFRLKVAARDGLCVITEQDIGHCVAAHILPQSRPEYYSEVWGQPDSLFSAKYGLFMAIDCHHAWDNGKLALYPLGAGNYIVHWFFPSEPNKALHGKVIPRQQFRCPDQRLPDDRLLHFHYQQCVLKYMRGFAHGFPRQAAP